MKQRSMKARILDALRAARRDGVAFVEDGPISVIVKRERTLRWGWLVKLRVECAEGAKTLHQRGETQGHAIAALREWVETMDWGGPCL